MEEGVVLGYLAGPGSGGATLHRTVERLDQTVDLVTWNALFLSALERRTSGRPSEEEIMHGTLGVHPR